MKYFLHKDIFKDLIFLPKWRNFAKSGYSALAQILLKVF